MKLLDIISSAVATAAATVGTAWHDHVEPWLATFLSTTLHAEVRAVLPIAEGFVAKAVPALVDAAKSGNWQAFADAQWDAVVGTAKAAQEQAVSVAITSVATAVNSLIVSHPDVAEAAAVTPAPEASPAAAPAA